MPVLIGVAVGIALAGAVWLIAGGAHAIRRRYLAVRAGVARPASVRAARPVEPDWIYGGPWERAEAPARDAARPQPGEPNGDAAAPDPDDSRQVADDLLRAAESEAARILQRAEGRAREILTAAEEARQRLEQAAARDRALAAEERTRLTAFLSNVLNEVQQHGVGARIRDLRELRERRGKAEGD